MRSGSLRASLMPTMLRVRDQFGHGFRQQVATGAAGHVVQHDRQPALVGDRAEMRDQAGLGRPHVGRRDHQRGIGAERGGAAGLRDGLGGVRQAGAGQHRNAPADASRPRSRSRASYSASNSAAASPVEPATTTPWVPPSSCCLQQAAPGVEVELAGGRERRRQRGDAAGKWQVRFCLRKGMLARMLSRDPAMLLAARKRGQVCWRHAPRHLPGRHSDSEVDAGSRLDRSSTAPRPRRTKTTC